MHATKIAKYPHYSDCVRLCFSGCVGAGDGVLFFSGTTIHPKFIQQTIFFAFVNVTSAVRDTSICQSGLSIHTRRVQVERSGLEGILMLVHDQTRAAMEVAILRGNYSVLHD